MVVLVTIKKRFRKNIENWLRYEHFPKIHIFLNYAGWLRNIVIKLVHSLDSHTVPLPEKFGHDRVKTLAEWENLDLESGISLDPCMRSLQKDIAEVPLR